MSSVIWEQFRVEGAAPWSTSVEIELDDHQSVRLTLWCGDLRQTFRVGDQVACRELGEALLRTAAQASISRYTQVDRGIMDGNPHPGLPRGSGSARAPINLPSVDDLS